MDTGSSLTLGNVGSNAYTVGGALGEYRIVWVCSYDASNPVPATTGLKMLVRMPYVTGSVFNNGTCTPMP
jgi:hypothetical protein